MQSGAGNTSSGTGYGTSSSWAAETVDVHATNYTFSGSIVAAGSASSSADGLGSSAGVGTAGTVTGDGSGPVSTTSTSILQSLSKGDYSITVGKSTLFATITVNGREYLVAKEVAVALSRATRRYIHGCLCGRRHRRGRGVFRHSGRRRQERRPLKRGRYALRCEGGSHHRCLSTERGRWGAL